MSDHEFDWSDLAFASKKPIRDLKPLFIPAPRELSAKRFTHLIKTYLPQGNIVVGLAKEPYVEGFENQPQFKTLQLGAIQPLIAKVNKSSSKHKIYTLHYFQRELPHLIEKLRLKKVLLINGSWKHAFHNLPAYYTLVNQDVPYEMLSPFADEQEAKEYETRVMRQITKPRASSPLSETQMMSFAHAAAKISFDYNFQTGAVLAKKGGTTYKLLAYSYNKVVPFQTHAMHYGASREQNFSPPHDLNHYDTVHAEVEMVLKAGKEKIGLKGTSLFVNLMPCPACARMLSETDIAEIIYSLDHSDGYAVQLLEYAGKKVRRIVA